MLSYLDLETLRERDDGEPAPAVVDFKVKNSLITQDQADSDPRAGLYLGTLALGLSGEGAVLRAGRQAGQGWKCSPSWCHAWAAWPGGKEL